MKAIPLNIRQELKRSTVTVTVSTKHLWLLHIGVVIMKLGGQIAGFGAVKVKEV
jgi:hypothetical protein